MAGKGAATVDGRSPRKRPRGPAPDPADEAQIRLPSLADVVHGDRASAVVDQNQTWALLTGTISRLESASRSQGRQNASAQGQDSIDATLPPNTDTQPFDEADALPLDLCPKESIRIRSKNSLDWCVVIPARVEACATNDYLSSAVSWDDSPPDDGEADAENLFVQGLLQFRHPYEPLPSSVAKAWHSFAVSNLGTDEFKAFARLRLGNWEACLRSLYYRLRHNSLERFYVHTGIHVFLYLRTARDAPLRALVTCCSAGMRGMLDKAQVAYDVRDGADGGGTRGEDSTATVVIRGTAEVHALYEFLLAQGLRLGTAQDLPRIYCERPFVGGTLHKLPLKIVAEMKAGLGAEGEQHVAEFSGPVLPRQLSLMVRALGRTQKGEFEVAARTSASARTANLVLGELADGERRNFSFASTSATRNEEAEVEDSAQVGRQLPGHRVLSRVVCEGHKYSAAFQS